jgi:uncharacterized membrane protein YjjP (DUF1212 family)
MGMTMMASGSYHVQVEQSLMRLAAVYSVIQVYCLITSDGPPRLG